MESPFYIDTITYFDFFHIFSQYPDNYILLETVVMSGTRFLWSLERLHFYRNNFKIVFDQLVQDSLYVMRKTTQQTAAILRGIPSPLLYGGGLQKDQGGWEGIFCGSFGPIPTQANIYLQLQVILHIILKNYFAPTNKKTGNFLLGLGPYQLVLHQLVQNSLYVISNAPSKQLED